MKKKKLYLAAAILLFALIAGIAIVSAAPPPPVPQQLGKTDTQFPNVTATECRNCHGGQPTPLKEFPANNIHHFMIGKRTTTLGCNDCHPNDNLGNMYIEPNCINCHNGTGWYKNPAINLTLIRGQPGRPHHNTTKNSASNLAVPAAYMAADRNCKPCHGEGIIDNYNDGHEIKNLAPQLVSVFADFKINATQNELDTGVPGVEWGGCAACHDSAAANPIINNNHDTHHYETTSMLGRQCNYCHVSYGPRAEPIPDYSAEPSASPLRVWFNDSTGPYFDFYSAFNWDSSIRHIEINNATMLVAGDTINGTGCLKCHSYRDLHTIEAAGPNPNAQYNIDNSIGGYGHVGNDTDCNGCHAGWSASAVSPVEGPISTGLDSVVPGNMVAGADVDVTLTGNNFVQTPKYTTTVLLDGQPITVKSSADKQIVATIPGTATVGTHAIQVAVDGVTSPLLTVSVAAPVIITSATLTSGVITIDGASFGTEAQQMVTINNAGGMVASDNINSWTDTQIVAASTLANVGDTVTVSTPYGSATATITAGTVVDSVTVTYPNAAGITWKRGTSKTVTWDRAGSDQAGTVKIELMQGTSVKKTLASSASNDGSQSVTIPSSTQTGSYTIRITSLNHSPEYSDSSDNTFQVTRN